MNLNQKQYNVLSLPEEIKVYTCKSDKGYLTVYGDIHGLNNLAYCFAHSSLNSDHILYLPFRQFGLTNYLEEKEGKQSARDMVVLHHKLQLNYKEWKSIRASILRNKSIEFSVHIDELLPERLDTKPYRNYYYHENKDIIFIRDYVNTIFLIGSREVFGSIANDCKSLSMSEPDKFYNEYPGYHDHRHMDRYIGKRDWSFAIDFYDAKIWGR